MKKFFRCFGATAAGLGSYFAISVLSIVIITLLLTKIPVLSWIAKIIIPSSVDDGFAWGRLIYIPACFFARLLSGMLVAKISGDYSSVEKISLMIIGITFLSIFALSAIVNIIYLIMGQSTLSNVLQNIVFIISAIFIISDAKNVN